MRKSIPFLIFISLITACRPAYKLYEIEHLVPPEEPIPYYLKNLAIVKPEFRGEEDSLKIRIFEALAGSLKWQLEESPLIDTVNIFSLDKPELVLADTGNWQSLEKISLDSNVDGFIWISLIGKEFNWSSSFEYEYDNWGTSYIEIRNFDLNTNLLVNFVLVDPYFRHVSYQSVNEDYHWTWKSYNLQDDSLALADSTWGYQALANQIGQQYAKTIAPYWQTDFRKWYRGKSKLMKQAYQMVLAGNQDEAAVIWEQILDLPAGKRDKNPALLNLALYAELNDRLDEAINYANRANREMNSIYVQDYIRALTKRKEYTRKLNNLFNR